MYCKYTLVQLLLPHGLILKMQICQWCPLWSPDNVRTIAKWTSARFTLKVMSTELHYYGHFRCVQTSHNVQTCHRVHFCGLFLLQFNKSLSSSTQWPHQLCALLALAYMASVWGRSTSANTGHAYSNKSLQWRRQWRNKMLWWEQNKDSWEWGGYVPKRAVRGILVEIKMSGYRLCVFGVT